MEVKSVELSACVETPLAEKSLSCTLVEAGEVSRVSSLNAPPLGVRFWLLLKAGC